MDDLLPPTIVVATTVGRILLGVACLGVLSTAAAMIRIHNAEYQITAHRASLFAAASFSASVIAVVAAMLVSPSF
jgi:hypothetical protein